MAIINIDGVDHEVQNGINLLEAVIALGIDLPYFCWHPAMGSVGSCRQCAVTQYADENDERGRLVMGCMTPASDGMRISLNGEKESEFRGSMIELVMTNHPHDCPVCEEGGECHLQDMTEISAHTERRYRGKKRTHNNQYLGPFINHEMNRCIACYRCVRYYDDYAGGKDLQAQSSHNHVFFGRHEDGELESEFAGNLVEVCPTGVFTDKTFSQHYARKWDLQTAPSICANCGVGCNTTPGERYGTVRRVVNRYNSELNSYFLCDRGRFGYDYTNEATRIEQPASIVDGKQQVVEVAAITEQLNHIITHSRESDHVMIGIGSPRSSVEANHALRTLVGGSHFFAGISQKDHEQLSMICEILKSKTTHTPSIKQIEEADAVLILGEDVLNTAPRIALALRQSVRNRSFDMARENRIFEWQDAAVRNLAQNEKSPLYILSTHGTGIDDISEKCYHSSPDNISQLGFAIADTIATGNSSSYNLPTADAQLVAKISESLQGAKHPLIISGTGSGNIQTIEAAANVALALGDKRGKPSDLYLAVPESNSLGLSLMFSGVKGADLAGASNALQQAKGDNLATTLVVVENDLYRRASKEDVDQLLSYADNIIVIDHTKNQTTEKATALLPAATVFESQGSLVNAEGRAQRYYAAFSKKQFHESSESQSSWMWLKDIADNSSPVKDWTTTEDVTEHCAANNELFSALTDASVNEEYRQHGLKSPRQTHRASGRTAMKAQGRVAEHKRPDDEDSPLTFSMEGAPNNQPFSIKPETWSPGWNSNQSILKFQEIIDTPDIGGVNIISQSSVSAKRPSYSAPLSSGGTAQSGFLAVPVCKIFGSEELSSHCPPIQKRQGKTTLTMNSDDAQSLGAKVGSQVQVTLGSVSVKLVLSIDNTLAAKIVGIPIGMTDFGGADTALPATVELSPLGGSDNG